MDYDTLRNMLGDSEYLLTDLPYSVIVRSVKLDKSGIEMIFACGIDDFAEVNEFELTEEIFPAEDGLPACLVTLATSEAFPVRVWQFDDIKEAVTE